MRAAEDADAVPALLLMGPTGSGKSALALRLAERWPIEIISVDSAQVYRGLDIGTAKPTRAERAAVRHHLLDVCDPGEAYSAGRFRREALELIGQVRARGHVPLLVGGTMLYFHALTRGLAPLPGADPVVRAGLLERAEREGWPALHAELARIDPLAASRIRPADAQRIQRALEVYALTGTPLTQLQASVPEPATRWTSLAIATPDRAALYASLDARLERMLAQGFLDEVRTLQARGDLNEDLPSLRAVGYRQFWAHLQGRTSHAEAVEAARRATRQLAKRQLTWLRSMHGVEWLPALEDQAVAAIEAYLERLLPEGAGRGL